MADNEQGEARAAILRAIANQVSGGVGPQALHHLAEAYALVVSPHRSTSGASAIPK